MEQVEQVNLELKNGNKFLGLEVLLFIEVQLQFWLADPNYEQLDFKHKHQTWDTHFYEEEGDTLDWGALSMSTSEPSENISWEKLLQVF